MLFQDRQSMQRVFVFVKLSRFLEDVLQSEELIFGAATQTKTALAVLQLWFHYFSAFPFKAFGIYFPGKLRSDIPL